MVLRAILFLIGSVRSIITFLLLSTKLRADDFSGRVIGVSDGETISSMHDGRAEKFRFNGIDSPENRQAYGNRAKQFVSTLAFGK